MPPRCDWSITGDLLKMRAPESRTDERPCLHCGTPFHGERGEEFCCAGCAQVYQVIQSRGLDRFYDLKPASVSPVGNAVLQVRDLSWLRQAAERAQSEDRSVAELNLDVRGLSCIGCVWLIERLYQEQPGALSIEVSPQQGGMHLRWQPEVFNLVSFATELQRFGYLVGPAGKERGRDADAVSGRMGLCAAFALNAMLFTLPGYLGMESTFALARLFGLLAWLFATLALVVGGGYFISRAWTSLRRGLLHIDFPIALGVVAAYAGSVAGFLSGHERWVYFDFVAIFMFLMLLGRWLQERAIERSQTRTLSDLPAVQTVSVEGQPVPVRELDSGTTYTVQCGQVVPVRSVLGLQSATFSLEWINGEPDPRVYPAGAVVPSGALLLDRAPTDLRSLESWSAGLLRQLTDSHPEDRRNRLLESTLRIYISVVLFASALALFGWWGYLEDPVQGIQSAISLLVVSCPCAIGVAFPLINQRSITRLHHFGLFVRKESFWGRFRGVRTVVFDKTGTLTLEAPQLLNPEVLRGLDEEARTALGHLVAESPHPFARALRESLAHLGEAILPPPQPVSETPGCGSSWDSASGHYRLGRPDWVLGEKRATGAGSPAGQTEGDSALARDGMVLAQFRFSESVRPGAAEELAALRSCGYRLQILSGDRPERVKALAGRLGLRPEEALGGLTPQEKLQWVETHARTDALYLGDGANDALAFNASRCRGTPVTDRSALESKADFLFLCRGLHAIGRLFQMARLRQRAISAVFSFAVAYNLAAATLCFLGLMHPLLAAILMPLSSVATLTLSSLGLGGWAGRDPRLKRRPRGQTPAR